MVNRLAAETSPYLRQHAENPVDWYPWGEEAFEEARRRDVPVFLSVGYSACHWCHVMAHESFEDEEVARVLNDRFVAVKVDREERPDVDAVYMEAVTGLTGRGGWPLSVFLTPDGRPFFGGTYWPPDDRHGMPGFRRVLDAVYEAWTERRDELESSADTIASAVAARARTEAADELDLGVSDRATQVIASRAWDRRHGGFGTAPKFPQAMTIDYLLDRHARTGEQEPLAAAVHALDAMARGGIHDQLAGGFHRYSTDERWLVPHFEKMLYDNALLAPAYAKASLAGQEHYARTARSTLDYLLRDMRLEDGGFASATDADSEGVEGRYFVWSTEEFTEVVRSAGADPDRYAAFFGVTPGGNWEGTNILHEPVDRQRFAEARGLEPHAFAGELASVRAALLARRAPRVAPERDEKVLTSWNALAVRAFALAGAWLDEPAYVDVAVATAAFLRDHLVVDGRLHHVRTSGQVSVPALLEDVALLAQACLDLYAVRGDLAWYRWALQLAEDAVERFHDDEHGGFYASARDAEPLYVRPKDSWDNATPSGNSVMAGVCLRLGGYTGDPAWVDLGHEVLRAFQPQVEQAPTGYGWLLAVVEHALAGPREVAVVGAPGPSRDALARELWRQPLPGTVIAVADGPTDEVPLLSGRTAMNAHPAAYVCHHHVCERPVSDPTELHTALSAR